MYRETTRVTIVPSIVLSKLEGLLSWISFWRLYSPTRPRLVCCDEVNLGKPCMLTCLLGWVQVGFCCSWIVRWKPKVPVLSPLVRKVRKVRMVSPRAAPFGPDWLPADSGAPPSASRLPVDHTKFPALLPSYLTQVRTAYQSEGYEAGDAPKTFNLKGFSRVRLLFLSFTSTSSFRLTQRLRLYPQLFSFTPIHQRSQRYC